MAIRRRTNVGSRSNRPNGLGESASLTSARRSAARGVREIFRDFRVEAIEREHYRLIPIIRRGLKGALFNWGLRPLYNLLPEETARRFANKVLVIAVKGVHRSAMPTGSRRSLAARH